MKPTLRDRVVAFITEHPYCKRSEFSHLDPKGGALSIILNRLVRDNVIDRIGDVEERDGAMYVMANVAETMGCDVPRTPSVWAYAQGIRI